MSRIRSAFEAHPGLLVPFITVGDPDLPTTVDLIVALAAQGAGVIELGLPYSDPIADGPTIQASSQRALDRGVKLADVFGVVRAVRERSDVPLVLFTYCNPIYRYGLERFLQEAAAAGADGILMPDIPPEEAEDLRAIAARVGLDVIFLVAPTSTPERVKLICEASSGFVYVVAATGVTGARAQLASDLREKLALVKRHAHRNGTPLPVAVGFGVSTPEQVAEIRAMGADGVIVGSALVERIGRWGLAPEVDKASLLDRVGRFAAELQGHGFPKA
jgi:tryptophan synthase alpha chain